MEIVLPVPLGFAIKPPWHEKRGKVVYGKYKEEPACTGVATIESAATQSG